MFEIPKWGSYITKPISRGDSQLSLQAEPFRTCWVPVKIGFSDRNFSTKHQTNAKSPGTRMILGVSRFDFRPCFTRWPTCSCCWKYFLRWYGHCVCTWRPERTVVPFCGSDKCSFWPLKSSLFLSNHKSQRRDEHGGLPGAVSSTVKDTESPLWRRWNGDHGCRTHHCSSRCIRYIHPPEAVYWEKFEHLKPAWIGYLVTDHIPTVYLVTT